MRIPTARRLRVPWASVCENWHGFKRNQPGSGGPSPSVRRSAGGATLLFLALFQGTLLVVRVLAETLLEVADPFAEALADPSDAAGTKQQYEEQRDDEYLPGADGDLVTEMRPFSPPHHPFSGKPCSRVPACKGEHTKN